MFTFDDLFLVKRLDKYTGSEYSYLRDVFVYAILHCINNRRDYWKHTLASMLTEARLWRKIKGEDAKKDFIMEYAHTIEEFVRYIVEENDYDTAFLTYNYWIGKKLEKYNCYYSRKAVF